MTRSEGTETKDSPNYRARPRGVAAHHEIKSIHMRQFNKLRRLNTALGLLVIYKCRRGQKGR